MVGKRIIILIILISLIFIYFKSYKTDLVYVQSDIDDKNYLVRNIDDKQKAANTLARIKKNIFFLTNYLYSKKDTDFKEYKPYIEQLNRRIQDVVINESDDDSIYTSYSVNKGEQIVFCLRSKHEKNKLHQLNLIMYVTLHEMAHIGCPEYGHTDLFKKIFAFFTKTASEIGIYKKVDFDNDPTEYCGLMITDSII